MVVLFQLELLCGNVNFTFVDGRLAVKNQSSGVGGNVVGRRDLPSASLHCCTLPGIIVGAFRNLCIILAHGLVDHVIEQLASTVKASIALWLLAQVLAGFAC